MGSLGTTEYTVGGGLVEVSVIVQPARLGGVTISTKSVFTVMVHLVEQKAT